MLRIFRRNGDPRWACEANEVDTDGIRERERAARVAEADEEVLRGGAEGRRQGCIPQRPAQVSARGETVSLHARDLPPTVRSGTSGKTEGSAGHAADSRQD